MNDQPEPPIHFPRTTLIGALVLLVVGLLLWPRLRQEFGATGAMGQVMTGALSLSP
jgi:hypothetical protein